MRTSVCLPQPDEVWTSALSYRPVAVPRRSLGDATNQTRRFPELHPARQSAGRPALPSHILHASRNVGSVASRVSTV